MSDHASSSETPAAPRSVGRAPASDTPRDASVATVPDAVLDSGRRHRAIFDSAVDFAIIATNRNGQVTDWNTGAERIFGWTANEMQGETAECIFTPDDRAARRLDTEMRVALDRGRSSDERWHLRRDGSRFWASGELMLIRDGGDAHVGFLKILRDRTAEHEAGKALRDAETDLQRAQAAGGVGVFSVDVADNVLQATPEFCRLFGVPVRRRFEPEEIERLILPQDVALASTAATRFTGAVLPDVEYRIRCADSGEIRWIARRAEVERDGAGRAIRFFGVVRDITERRTAVDALARSEQRYRALFNAIDDGFCIIEFLDGPNGPASDYVHVEANTGYERHTGIADVVGKTVRDLAPDEADGWVALYGDVLRTGKPIRFERDFLAAGRHIEVSAARIEPASRRQVSVLFRDITARKRSETALRGSEALARENVQRVQLALAAGAIIGTWLWDLPRDRLTVDEGFACSFGLDPAIGRVDLRLDQVVASVHPDDKPAMTAAINQAIARGGAYAHQCRVRRADGRYYWIEASGRVDHGPDGTPMSFPGVLIDVEERRAVAADRDRAATALRALNETLEQRIAERTAELMHAEDALRQSQKMEAIGQLTGGVAHDFNNLLTVIRSSVDLLKRPDLVEERRARYIAAISDTVERAAKLTGQLLAFARRQALKPETFAACDSVRMLTDMLGTLTGSRIEVVTELPETSCFVNADPSQFDTALVNMAVNARDAMDGEGRLTIRVRGVGEIPGIRLQPAVPGAFVAVSITDTGNGIPPDQLEQIFEPFFTTKEIGRGTGLGLSQVFGFAKQSGGEIMVQSRVDEGSTFTIFLPRVAEQARPPEDGEPAQRMDGHGACVLVVEDNKDVGGFATQTLAELGYQTVWATSAEQALAELAKDADRFDVVFSDVVMPGMSGIELAQRLRRQCPDLPVVLASGYSDVLAQNGTDGFELLHKPYSIEQLSRVLRKAAPARR